MKTYQDLVVRGNQQMLDRFIAVMEEYLTGGWTRNYRREAELSKVALGKMYCFTCTAQGTRPASDLWLATRSDGSLYVSNILAKEFSSLTYDQYNAILSDFYNTCVGISAQDTGVTVELSNPNPNLEDFLSANTADLLRSFSVGANKTILHPLDRKRWNEFLVSAFHEGAALDTSMLERWLIEEEKWPEDEAHRLTVEYEHARDLLQVYESQQV